MPLRWTIEDQSDHLLVRVEGLWHIQPILKLIDLIAVRCREDGYSRVLCDCRALQSHFNEVDRFLAAVRVADRLGATQLAVLVAADAVVTPSAAKAAARRGGRVFVTRDPEEARRWLFAGTS